MEPMKQREALTGEINWILSLTNLYGDQSVEVKTGG